MNHIIFNQSDRIGILQIKRSDGKGNALHLDLLKELNEAITTISNNEEITSLIITGTGHYFSTGLDLNDITESNLESVKEYFNLSSDVFFKLFTLPIPTVGAMNGHSVAGGAVLAVSCDYRIFRNGNYKFGFTGINIGIPYPLVPLEIIKFSIPSYMIAEILLQGKLIDPTTCYQKNIINDLVHGDTDLIDYAKNYLSKEVRAPKQNYKFLKENLQEAVVNRIKLRKELHDNLQFNLFSNTDLQGTLKKMTKKYKN
ncbi:MAG: enoyl-CoA hydratase/isomerase family protein [Candidatus Hodarchaeales archaeon]|jgi:enoyl-CoA hydratase